MPVAAGGMATIWAAILKGSRGFERLVAIKTMLPELCGDPRFEQMFLADANLAARLLHPNTVQVFDLGEDQGALFLVMEWLDGVSLMQLMRAARSRGGVPLGIAVGIIRQACAGLQAAHELTDDDGNCLGLVHRDVSPENIFVTYSGVVKLIDFGVATTTESRASAPDGLKGKRSYMAPEQVCGRPFDRRADIFALGAVLYALTTGKHPFRRETALDTLLAVTAPSPVAPPHEHDATYPRDLEAVVLKALAKIPEERYASAAELERALVATRASKALRIDEGISSFVRSVMGSAPEQMHQRLASARQLARGTPAGVQLQRSPTERLHLQKRLSQPKALLDWKQ